MSNQMKPRPPGVYVDPFGGGARITIFDDTGRYISGTLTNEALLAFGKQCVTAAVSLYPKKIIVPGG